MTTRHLARVMLVVALAAAAPRRAEAQDTAHVGFTTAGLLSLQPVDPTYVGPEGPYLDRGLGGSGPGLAMGVNILNDHLALDFEFSTAWLSVPQKGRLVNGGAGTGRLRDAMVTALVGRQVGAGRTRANLLGGGSYLIGTPSSNGVPRPGREEEVFPAALTFGTDILTVIAPKVSLLVTARVYPWLQRSDSAQQLGVGGNVFRVGAGLRLSISRD